MVISYTSRLLSQLFREPDSAINRISSSRNCRWTLKSGKTRLISRPRQCWVWIGFREISQTFIIVILDERFIHQVGVAAGAVLNEREVEGRIECRGEVGLANCTIICTGLPRVISRRCISRASR